MLSEFIAGIAAILAALSVVHYVKRWKAARRQREWSVVIPPSRSR